MRIGETGPPFVYLHGEGGSGGDPAVDLLAAEFRVLTPELGGFGSTDAQAVLLVLDQLGGEGCTLAGASLGAVLALEVALAAPERIEALILLSPAALPAGSQLTTLKVPTLVVCGTRDVLSPPGQGRAYRELMPNCSYVLLYDAGHELGQDRPEALAALLADFGRRRETFVVGAPP